MASNKNQHFVPLCYLRPFTFEAAGAAINLFNIDRIRFIKMAPVRHQCSGDYFYGTDHLLESAIQHVEGSYAESCRRILSPGYSLTDFDRTVLRVFWYLQHVRTDGASRRAVEMSHAMSDVAGVQDQSYRLKIREAVQVSMRIFSETMDAVDDLKFCLFRNRTSTPFFTSDDPAILTNRWYLTDSRTRGRSFGIHSAGALTLLPLSPEVLCVGYDGDVYSIPHDSGWVTLRRDADVAALNELQFISCRASVFVRDVKHEPLVVQAFNVSAHRRPRARYAIHYAVLDRIEGDYKRYRVVDPSEDRELSEAIVHTEVIHPHPTSWPSTLAWRSGGTVYTNGSARGYVRKSAIGRGGRSSDGFRKERSIR